MTRKKPLALLVGTSKRVIPELSNDLGLDITYSADLDGLPALVEFDIIFIDWLNYYSNREYDAQQSGEVFFRRPPLTGDNFHPRVLRPAFSEAIGMGRLIAVIAGATYDASYYDWMPIPDEIKVLGLNSTKGPSPCGLDERTTGPLRELMDQFSGSMEWRIAFSVAAPPYRKCFA